MEDRANILREMQVCRFCLSSEEQDLTNIYEKHRIDSKHSVPLPLQIMACIAIEVFRNDGMPQLICHSCRNMTIQAYTFKSNCKKADDALKLFVATGQLSKPFMEKVDQPIAISRKPLTRKGLNREQPQTPRLQPRPQHLSMDNNDILTLNYDVSLEQQNTTRDENEDQRIIGYEEDMEEGVRAVDDSDYNSLEDEFRLNKTMKVNQVKTDCFPCPYCERSFPLKQLVDLHVPIHNRERSYECEECLKKFFTKYDLQKHLLTHNENKPFICEACNKSFSREALLRRHEKIHSDVPKYVCNHCEKTFLTKKYLDFHMEKHNKKRPYTCSVCNKSFVFKQGLERHEIVHSNNKPHKCNYCEASFTSAIKLTRHITTHAGLRPYPCKLCGRTFLLSHHLTRHMRSHYAAQSSSPDVAIGQHKCDICSMSFRRKDSLINHSAIHSMVNLRCVICNTTFETANMVKEHITTHLTGLPFPCEKCDYSFETSEQLEEHELKHAEMEYEEQIEKEVMSEALTHRQDGSTNNEDEVYDEDVTEYTIQDLENQDVVLRQASRHETESQDVVGSVDKYIEFLKDELGSDLEDNEEAQNQNIADVGELQQEAAQESEPIKPIVRQEGTKMYQRKAPIERKIPPKIISPPTKVAPLQQITQPDVLIDDFRDLTPQTLSSLQSKKLVNMKIGDKMMKVQKFIVSKEEMKLMAKQGILEMKGGQVVLKNPGQPVLNATLKPIQKTDIESILDRKFENRYQVKKYQRSSGLGARPATDDNTSENLQEKFSNASTANLSEK